MLLIENILVSDDIYKVKFCCNIKKCFGICCIKGDAGAPLEIEEISILEDFIDEITPYMTENGVDVVKKSGVFDYDIEGQFATPLIKDKECAFINFENGIAVCSIEKAYDDGKINFQKPLSCHLYPIRIRKLTSGEVVNYDKWDICKMALVKGKRKRLPLYTFLKKPLIRKYGEMWYKELDIECRKLETL